MYLAGYLKAQHSGLVQNPKKGARIIKNNKIKSKQTDLARLSSAAVLFLYTTVLLFCTTVLLFCVTAQLLCANRQIDLIGNFENQFLILHPQSQPQFSEFCLQPQGFLERERKKRTKMMKKKTFKQEKKMTKKTAKRQTKNSL